MRSGRRTVRPGPPRRRWAVVLVPVVLAAVVGTLAAAGPALAGRPGGAPRAAGSAPLLGEAVREYTTMTATRYQHRNVERRGVGTYFYDCVGFVTYALGQAAPTAQATILDTFHVRPGYVPSPGLYVRLFDALDGTQPGWAPVRTVAALRPGDVVAWSYRAASSSNEPGGDHRARGHALIVGSVPEPSGPGSYLVTVWDSTGTPHGPDDTRRTNRKNLPDAAGRPSGLGSGTVRLDAAPDGALLTVHWSPTSGPVAPAEFAMGRPTA